MRFVDKEITRNSLDEDKRNLVSKHQGMRVLLRDSHKGLVDAQILKDIDVDTYKIVRIRGLIKDENTLPERLHYHDLELMYFCYQGISQP